MWDRAGQGRWGEGYQLPLNWLSYLFRVHVYGQSEIRDLGRVAQHATVLTLQENLQV